MEKRYFRRVIRGIGGMSSNQDMCTVEFQKKHWADKIKEYDWNSKDIWGLSWGDPDKPYNKLGDYRKIKEEYLLPHITNKVVLDIGSGGGKWLRYMSEARKVIAVDLDTTAFRYILDHVDLDNISFYKTEGCELECIQTYSIDFIFAMDCIVYVPKTALAGYFREFARVLKKDGAFCIHLPCKDKCNPISRFLHQFYNDAVLQNGFADLSKKDIKELCGIFPDVVIDYDTIVHGILLLKGMGYNEIRV